MTSGRDRDPCSDRWAVILGVSAGSGNAIARAVVRDPGLHVFGVHRGHYADLAKDLEEQLGATGRRAVLHVANAGTPDGVRACADALAAVAGKRSVGLLVHAISGASLGHFLDHPGGFEPRHVEKTFNYMAHSFVYWAQELHRRELLASGARLLGLTNLLHDSLIDHCGLIAACKGALQMYVKYLALELGPLGHRVNLLKFGSLMTPALTRMLGPEAVQRLETKYAELIPAGRLLTADDLGRVVSYLARAESDWFNGATIDYTGGMSLRLLDVVARSA
jgi:NAD(P)-dependent dehydrogenase (short-subunit alcohol dehydrogenase family)